MTDHAMKLTRAVEVLREFGARRVVLFGSAHTCPEQAVDIDLAVEGVPIPRLLDADVAVNEAVQFPVDLISREENPDFFNLVTKRGVVLYECA